MAVPTTLSLSQVLRAERDDARELAARRLDLIDDLADLAAHYQEALREVMRAFGNPRAERDPDQIAREALTRTPGGIR